MPVVVIPWRGGCPYRKRALDYVLSRYQWPVTVAECLSGPWVKANAVMPAVQATDAEIVVMADADIFCDELEDAVRAVEQGAPWAVPHRNVHRLTPEATSAVLAGQDWSGQAFVQRPYPGVEGGGYVVTKKTTLLEIPLDPRFVGWGQEDESHGVALTTMLGAPWRGEAPLVHLWHPSQERLSRTRGNREGWNLRRRYFEARQNTAAMRELIEEAHDARRSAQQTLHNHYSLGVN